ncbi:MAG: hypothetical protein GX162_08780 [Firmicutes bacterium]|nr:hypothetical protein [Bacillota bacterium]
MKALAKKGANLKDRHRTEDRCGSAGHDAVLAMSAFHQLFSGEWMKRQDLFRVGELQ